MLGYCTTPHGDAVQYVLSHGLPEWSREHIAGLARCGGASATSGTTDGRGEGQGSVEPRERSSDRGGDASASPASHVAIVLPGVDLSAGGGSPDGVDRDAAAAGQLLFASAGDCSTERSGVVASGALVVDDYEDTEVGFPPGDPKRLRLGESQGCCLCRAQPA